jgi:hypothetical protein
MNRTLEMNPFPVIDTFVNEAADTGEWTQQY